MFTRSDFEGLISKLPSNLFLMWPKIGQRSPHSFLYSSLFSVLLTDEPSNIKFEILDKMAALITAAFGLVAALAWNDLIKNLFAQIFGTADTIVPMIIYSLIATVLAVILTLFVARTTSKAKSVIEKKLFKCKLCKFETGIESAYLEHNVKEHAANPDKFFMK